MSITRQGRAYIVAAALLGTSVASMAACAAEAAKTAPKADAQASSTDKRLMVSSDGFKAEHDIGSARIAIFQGDIDAAKTLVKDAQAELKTVGQQAPKDFPNGAPTADGKGSGNTDVIPIDGQMAVADTMVLTPDKTAKVKEANEHLKRGETDQAMDTLKQGAINVTFTRVLLPIKETDAHVDTAANLLSQGKYYEANLALKAAQDLLQTDTVAFGDTATQAAKVTGLPAESTPASTATATPAPVKK